MALSLTQEMLSLKERVSDFAQRNIYLRSDLITVETFPLDIWHMMGEEGLLGLGIPKEYGGLGGNYLSIIIAGQALVQGGHNIGITVSWLMHQIISRFFIMRFGTDQQKHTYLHDLSHGRKTACLAISEHQKGSHPKYLTTKAEKDGNRYILTGEKTFITNGPIADTFIVLAVTDTLGERKRFTAFIIPRDSKGLSITEPIKLSFLRPCPHGGIILRECTVPSSAILGQKGTAYEEMSIPFRDIEDAMMMGPIVGGIRIQLELLIQYIKDHSINLSAELKTELGGLQSIIHTLDIMAYEAAGMLDSNILHVEFTSLLVYFRQLSTHVQSQLKLFISLFGIKTDTKYDLFTEDLVNSIKIAANIAHIKQIKLGEALFNKDIPL